MGMNMNMNFNNPGKKITQGPIEDITEVERAFLDARYKKQQEKDPSIDPEIDISETGAEDDYANGYNQQDSIDGTMRF